MPFQQVRPPGPVAGGYVNAVRFVPAHVLPGVQGGYGRVERAHYADPSGNWVAAPVSARAARAAAPRPYRPVGALPPPTYAPPPAPGALPPPPYQGPASYQPPNQAML